MLYYISIMEMHACEYISTFLCACVYIIFNNFGGCQSQTLNICLQTFDECVTRGGTDCDPVNLWMQIPFFCGHHSACWEPGNTWALQQVNK